MKSNNLSDYKRIVILGNAGSGKSYLAGKLSDVLGYQVLHLDKVFWLPKWEHISREELVRIQEEFMTCENWIIDGNYASSLDIRMKAADLVIYLDMNRLLCLHGAISRLKKKRPDMPDYLSDKVDAEFLKWIWNFNRDVKPKIMEMHKGYKETAFFTIPSRRELRKFILEAERQGG